LELIKMLIPYSPTGWTAYNMDDAKLPFLNGCCAMKVDSTSFAGAIAQQSPELLSKIAAVPIPKNHGSHNGLAFSGLWALGGGKNRAAAVEFLRFFYTKQNYYEFMVRNVQGFVPTYLPVANSPADQAGRRHPQGRDRRLQDRPALAGRRHRGGRAGLQRADLFSNGRPPRAGRFAAGGRSMGGG
jgi:ABC-type glycerol-3-phosphate transport system substrate-binding protein